MRWLLGRRERLRRKAADWIARLHGSHNERDRAEFERWYSAHPDHAAVYDRLLAVFEAAGSVRGEGLAGSRQAPANRPAQGHPVRYAVAIGALAAAALFAFLFLAAPMVAPDPQKRLQTEVFAAGGTGRHAVLTDGSEVFLSSGAQLLVAINGSERRLELEEGEVRFKVAHEARPFVVTAKGMEVVARGTEFIVRVVGNDTQVSLIEGRVDVSYSDAFSRPRVVRLRAGQNVAASAMSGAIAAPSATKVPVSPPEPMLQFDETRLEEAVELANRYSERKIRLADRPLGDLRITGTFAAGDTEAFARSVAAAFKLELEHSVAGDLWLRRP